MKKLSLFTIGWRSLCLIISIALSYSCKSVNDFRESPKPLSLSVLVEKGYRLSVLEGGDVIIVEDGSIEERTAANIHFLKDQLAKAESMRAKLLAQGAIRVELRKNER